MLSDSLKRYWWITLFRGIIAILFGIVVFTQTGIALVTLTLLFGAFVFADGAANIVSAFGGRDENENWGVLLLAGLAGVGVGILTLMSPGLTALALVFYIAIWAIATGLLEVAAAIRLRKEIEGEFWLALAGILSIGFGVLLMARPAVGALSVLWLIAGYSVAFGVSLIILAFRARGFAHSLLPSMKKA